MLRVSETHTLLAEKSLTRDTGWVVIRLGVLCLSAAGVETRVSRLLRDSEVVNMCLTKRGGGLNQTWDIR